jgi:hypothetical protein
MPSYEGCGSGCKQDKQPWKTAIKASQENLPRIPVCPHRQDLSRIGMVLKQSLREWDITIAGVECSSASSRGGACPNVSVLSERRFSDMPVDDRLL